MFQVATVKAGRRVTYDTQLGTGRQGNKKEKKDGWRTFASQVEGSKTVRVFLGVAGTFVVVVAGTVGHVQKGGSTQ